MFYPRRSLIIKSLFKIYLLCLVLVTCQAQAQEALDLQTSSQSPSPVLEEASRAVWKLRNPLIQGNGTGFFIAPKLLITNYHIILSLLKFGAFKDIELQHDTIPGVLKINKIKALSAELDLALLEIDSPSDTFLSIKEEPVSEAEDLFLLGYDEKSFHYTIKTGHLKQNDFYSHFPVNYPYLMGTSGGPILSTEGQVTGVLFSAISNWSISSNADMLKHFIDGDKGVRCLSQNPEQCMNSAMAIIYEKAKRSNVLAQHFLALMYAYEQNYEKAVHWLKLAAKQDFAPSLYNLAGHYRDGRGVEPNYEKAVELFEKAAKQSFAPSMNSLAVMHLNGVGMESNHKKAVELFEKAAKQGSTTATYNLAVMYLNGIAVDQDDKKAFQFFEEATKQGSNGAKHNLDMMRRDGRGI